MIAFGKTPCKFYAQPVCFFWGNLTGTEGLAHMIGNQDVYKRQEVYVAYRKAGYSKKFREEHEEMCIRDRNVYRL